MPDLDTQLHLKMFELFKRKQRLNSRIERVLEILLSKEIYGLEWGNPDSVEPLKFVRDRYVLPYINPQHTAVEIGPGGGRWTRYLLGFGRLYAVDFYPELLNELKRHFNEPSITFVKNNGTDFPGIAECSVDYIFSFGTFVHLNIPLIEAYLASMKSILKPGANVVIQYSDKTKIMAQLNEGFSDNTPDDMRRMVSNSGYRILEEDLTTMWHSSVIRFTK